jgi:formylmethanofuran dehydrogenase subunit A
MAALIPQELLAQQASRTGASLPARGELLIRGATVLTLDPAVPDLAVGDVHVRDGTILAVAQKIETPSAQTIDGSGMICIPGFVDTHFHHRSWRGTGCGGGAAAWSLTGRAQQPERKRRIVLTS